MCVCVCVRVRVRVYVWQPGHTRVNSGYTNWNRADKNKSCGENNLVDLFIISGREGRGRKKVTQIFTRLAVHVRGLRLALPDVREGERQAKVSEWFDH